MNGGPWPRGIDPLVDVIYVLEPNDTSPWVHTCFMNIFYRPKSVIFDPQLTQLLAYKLTKLSLNQWPLNVGQYSRPNDDDNDDDDDEQASRPRLIRRNKTDILRCATVRLVDRVFSRFIRGESKAVVKWLTVPDDWAGDYEAAYTQCSSYTRQSALTVSLDIACRQEQRSPDSHQLSTMAPVYAGTRIRSSPACIWMWSSGGQKANEVHATLVWCAITSDGQLKRIQR